ncbi:MAG: MgtC/SapB family protein [Vicinamibacterales bacterium]
MDPSVMDFPGVMDNLQEELLASVIRLPLAALLGTALALRPRRSGTPERQPAVVQTQIILAVVGALIMLVVGASLARAFGIVGAANLIRYRSKIDDPKDAVVMLCALSVGLASGVGLYGLAAIGTLFIAACLWVIEGFEPQTRIFELTVRFGAKTHELRPRLEEVLRRYKVKYELRTTAEDAVGYMATTPRSLRTDRVSNALMELEPSGKGAIEWDEKSKDKVPK